MHLARPLSLLLLLALVLLVPRSGAAQITPMAIGNVRVTPDGGPALVVATAAGGTTILFVENNFDTTREYSLSCTPSGVVTACSPEVGSVVLPPYQSIDVEVSFTVGASPGTGRVTLRASGTAWDTGYRDVTAAQPSAPSIALVNYSPDTWDRSHCLLAGAGEAAWRCGDLVVSHGLPGFATLGRERSLSLVYTSAQAVPRPVVTAQLTPPSVTTGLTGYWVGLKVNGVWRDSARYQPWTAGSRQVAIAFDATALATGAWPFELEVRSEYGAASYGAVTPGTLVVVNRAASPYGQGWSVGGLEMLVSGQPGGMGTGLLWVGGEGSARLYARQSPDTNRWVAPAGAFRDTIVRNPATGEYTRTLRHGIRVLFDAAGRHVATINRVGQRTDFDWTGSQLTAVRVPPDTVARPTYVLAYDGNSKLDRITDPAGRILEATVGAGRLVTLTDPDTKATTFAYDTPGRIIRRTNRRGYGTRFAYAKSLRVTEVRVPIGTGTDSAITTYAPWDEQGLATAFANQVAVSTSQVRTRVFGPRVGVADDVTFVVDRWGAPTQITDALGAVTTLVRGNAAVPALVTRVTYPNGRKVDLTWDARGNLTEERVVTTGLADAQPDLVTQYRYQAPQTRDAPDRVTAPGGIVTQFTYTAAGMLDRATAPNGHVTDFDYVAGGALVGSLRAVHELNVPVWDSVQRREVNAPSLSQRFGLNRLGNVVADTSPGGRVRGYARDTAQRVTQSYDPVGHHVSYVYDAVNRVREVREHLDEVPGSGFSTPLLTRYTYGTDLVDSIFDPRNVRRTYRYDAAGRLVAEGDEAGVEETFTMDAGGLVTSAVTRRGATISHAYDLAGRRIKTVWDSLDGFDRDSLRLTYDAMGQLTRAEAEGRAIARSWYPTGALKRDSSALVVDYAYDAAGRRSWYRTGLSTAVNRDSVVYRYDAVTGDLATIAVRWWSRTGLTDSVRFRWDRLGRRDTLLYSNGAVVQQMYDADGTPRVLCGRHDNPPTSPSPSVFNFAVVHTWVDREGLVRRTDTGIPHIPGCGAEHFQAVGPGQENSYDARHQLQRQVTGPSDWAYGYDGSGNRVEHIQNGERWTYTHPAQSNRLARRDFVPASGAGVWYTYSYRADGSRSSEMPCDAMVQCRTDEPGYRLYRYDGLGRTRSTFEAACGAWDVDTQQCLSPGGWSTSVCGYDPLGRLAWSCENGGPWLGYEGDRVVRTRPQHNVYFWTFVHAQGVDDPVLARYTQDQTFGRTYFFVTDGQGRQYVVGRGEGWDGRDDEDYTLRGGKLSGAGEVATSFGAQRLPSTSQPGLAFFRNRFYDQQTGRWTQEDPIGVAGGMNLYGFVGNNPTTFSDPFGLCPEEKRDKEGNCPGGLTVAEWNNVEAGIAEVRHAGMRDRLTRMLNNGEIRPVETLDDPDGFFGTNWHTPIVFGTRHHGRTGSSAFELSPPDIGFGLVHEVGHIDQVAGKTTQEINSMQARRKGDRGYSNFLERGANSGACLLVPHAQVFAAWCR